MEMNHLSLSDKDRGKVPKQYTGILDIWYAFSFDPNYMLKFGYIRYWYINGHFYKMRDRYGNFDFYDIRSYHTSSFEDMFDSLPPEYQEIIIWNFDLWK